MRDEDGDGEKDRDAARPAEPREDSDDQTEYDGDEEHRDVDRLQSSREAAGELSEDLHLKGKKSGCVEEALQQRHAESDLEHAVDDDRKRHGDRRDPPDLVAAEP